MNSTPSIQNLIDDYHMTNSILAGNREMKMAFQLRPATVEDKNFMIRLERITLARYIEKIMEWPLEYQINYYDTHFKPKHVSIILHNNQAIGALSILFRRRDIYFFYLYLLPQFQNKGIFTSIMEDIMKRAKKERKSIISSTFKENKVGKRLADRYGFQVIGEDSLRFYLKWTNP